MPEPDRPGSPERESYDGSCLCGAVRYRVTGPLGTMSNCHCTDCRKSHAAAFSTYIDVDRSVLRIVAGEDRLTTYRADSGTMRAFCPTCGSIILCFTATDPDWVDLSVATLATPTAKRPEYHIFVRSKAAWHDILDDRPRHQGAYGRGY
jgi:hypothetical protein